MKRIFSAVLTMVGLAVSTGCGGDTILVGFVVDGQSGQRMNFFKDDGTSKNLSDDSDNTKQIFTIIDGKFRRAVPCKAGDANGKNKIDADGCYKLDGLIRGQTVPIIAQFDGYERFHGTIAIASPDKDGNGKVSQVLGNIRMFPKNFKIDYKIFTHLAGRGLAGTTVACQIRQAIVENKTDGNFISPENTTSATIGGQSDDQGVVSLDKAGLVNGASYHCEAFRAEATDDRVLSGETDFIAGVSQAEQSISLKAGTGATDPLGAIYAIKSNADNSNDLLGDPSQLIITFNRPVEIVPNTVDCQSAIAVASPDTNGNKTVGKLKADTGFNNESESAVASLSADGLILTVAYRAPETAFEKDDFGSKVGFNGVYVRPAGGKFDGNQVRVVGSKTGLCSAETGSVGAASPLANSRTGVQKNVINLY